MAWKLVIVSGVLGLLIALAGTAMAAQGQITEVNPSGVHGIIVEDGTGDKIHFVNPVPQQDADWPPELNTPVTFEVACRGKHRFATNMEPGPSDEVVAK